MGVFEFPNFAEGTKAVGDAVAEATKKGAVSIIGLCCAFLGTFSFLRG